MCLTVGANVINGDEKDSHVSVQMHLMEGENDDNLMWPMKYKCTITLLNQIEDRCHHTKTYTYSKDKMDEHNSRVSGHASAGHGFSKFIALHKLYFQEDLQCQYLMDDCIYFRVKVEEVHSLHKPWLVQTDVK